VFGVALFGRSGALPLAGVVTIGFVCGLVVF